MQKVPHTLLFMCWVLTTHWRSSKNKIDLRVKRADDLFQETGKKISGLMKKLYIIKGNHYIWVVWSILGESRGEA